ncbi:preprotein translocase subunit SecE [Thiohalobacter thiocyanaticus]|uniref:Protein translocase subunit SecE n=1 Tax=Thiohalobacter thiocyanaticus TaxID=585455 RepID=A0A426QL25_9GAMM|nr:preprotein translocase subunit SecE [Thiohalobacter thiocyanaticus]RRQ22465.1 preprotein translocase subunit SecE [Thiohalobacter thiocyanaticus]
MNAKVDTEGSKLDTVKMGLAVALLMGGVVGFYHFADYNLLFRVLGLLAVVGVVLFIFAQTAKGAQAIGFIGSARMEVRKVVWPSRQETIQTALIVFAMVIIVGLILWLLDKFLFWAIGQVTG